MKATNQSTISGNGRRLNKNDMHSVYSPNLETKDDNIVDVMMMIMDDDGPKPMRNLRPTQKKRNGADQFYVEHQEEYESRGREADKVTRVTDHNNACPKMYDELNKRKSIANIKAIDPRPTPQKQTYEHKDQSGRSKMFIVVERANLRPRHRRSAIGPMRNDSRSRVTKCKSRSCQHSVPYKYLSNKSCQYTTDSKNSTTSDVSVIFRSSDKNKAKMERYLKMYEKSHCNNVNGTYPPEKKSKSSKELNREESESKHELESRNPDTSQPSVSSYNSYMSMDHEPMVAP